MVTEPSELSFAGLLRRLRAQAKLTQEELAAAAGVSARSVSNLERGINRTAHKDTAVLLAGALGLTGPAAGLFVAAARGTVPAGQVLAAAEGTGPRPGAVAGSPYRGLSAFGEQDAGWFFGWWWRRTPASRTSLVAHHPSRRSQCETRRFEGDQ